MGHRPVRRGSSGSHVHELRVQDGRVQKASAGQAIVSQGRSGSHTFSGCLSGCLAGEGVAPVKFQTFPISK